jgi:putative membrane protein
MKTLRSISACAIGLLFSFTAFVTPAVAQDNPKLSDAEVAHTAVTANQIDIDHAKIAKERSKNTEVLKFAETMANDHKAVIDQAVALVTKLGVTPQDNAVSKQLLADAAKTDKMLRTKTGKAFDKAYIDNEVAYHKAVIAAVEGLLIPESENAELKGLLQSIVPALNAHLEHAQMLQKQQSGK